MIVSIPVIAVYDNAGSEDIRLVIFLSYGTMSFVLILIFMVTFLSLTAPVMLSLKFPVKMKCSVLKGSLQIMKNRIQEISTL